MTYAGTKPVSRLKARRHHGILIMAFVFIALRLSLVVAPYLTRHSSSEPQSVTVVSADGEDYFPDRAQQQKQCGLSRRRFFMSGTGTVRLRSDGFVSQRIALNGSPQEIDLPQFRPAEGEVQQHIVLEGKADLVVTTNLADDRLDTKLDGTVSFDFSWTPLPNC